jgi:PAS domain-containing protein
LHDGFFDRCLGGIMGDQASEVTTSPKEQPAAAGSAGVSKWKASLTRRWPVLAGLTFGLVAGAISVRSTGGPRFDWLLMLAAAIAAIAVALLSVRLLLQSSLGTSPSTAQAVSTETDLRTDSHPNSHQDLLDSAGPAVVGIGADGSLIYVNPSAERLLGYHAHELKKVWGTVDILAPGEGLRLVAEVERLSGAPRSNEPTVSRRIAVYMNCVRNLPPSQVPSFDARLRHKDGTLLPVTLQISALRDRRAPLRHHTPDGRLLELELSLSQRQKAGNPLAVRCLLRDVTQQKQREHRLALQLRVSQIVGENTSPEVAAMRILEALCVSQGWDVALKWESTPKKTGSNSAPPGARPAATPKRFIKESMGLTLSPRRRPGRPRLAGWPPGLDRRPGLRAGQPRIQSAMRHGWSPAGRFRCAWATGARVLEFYCHFCLREDREAMAAVETVAASLGQMLARSQERGRAEEALPPAGDPAQLRRRRHLRRGPPRPGQLCQPRRRPPARRRTPQPDRQAGP